MRAALSVILMTVAACGGNSASTTTAQPDVSPTTSAPSPTPATSTTSTPIPLQLLVLGDSIAIPEMGCGQCVGFDQQYANHIKDVTGREVALRNEARPNAEISDLQTLLADDAAVQAAVAAADIIVVSIGYNNGPPWSSDVPCHPVDPTFDTDLLVSLRDFSEACMRETNETFRDDFDAVYALIEELANGRPQLRIDLGNFNNLLGNRGGDGTMDAVWAGQDVPGFSQADLPEALINMMIAIAGYNEVECETATAHGFVCAGLLEAFNGPDGTGSLADYVNPADFVHPNANGQRVIAQLLAKIDFGPPGISWSANSKDPILPP